VIYEEPSHSGAFLDLMVLFDLKKSRVVGVIVKAERYLLE
jgi:hypothetical protein